MCIGSHDRQGPLCTLQPDEQTSLLELWPCEVFRLLCLKQICSVHLLEILLDCSARFCSRSIVCLPVICMESPGRTRTGRVSFLLSPITPLYAFPGRIPSVSKSYLSGKTLLKVHKRFKFSHSSQPQFTQRNTESSGQQRIVKTGCKRVFSGDEFADE